MLQDLRYALRQIRKAPVFAIVAILTLALGIGANTAIFTLLDQALLRSLPVRHPEQLVRFRYVGVHTGNVNFYGGDEYDYFSYPMYRKLRDHNSVLSGVLANAEAQASVQWNNQPELVAAELISGNYFDLLGVRSAIGRLIVPADVVWLAGISIVVTLPVAMLLSRLMRSQLYNVSPADPIVIAGGVLLVALVVGLAALLPARRAASVEPMQALRTE